MLAAGGCDGAGPGKPAPAGAGQGAGPPLIELSEPGRPSGLRVGLGGVAVGPAGSAPRRLFAEPRSAAELLGLAAAYAPFSQPIDGERLTFRGWGAGLASPVERRMLAEWGKRTAAQASSPESSLGLVFSWHRAGPPGRCDEIAVYLSGDVEGTSCTAAGDLRGRLGAEALARIYSWYDGVAPFQAVGEESFQIGTGQWRVIFAGRGRRPPNEAESAEIAAFGLGLQRELAARRGGEPVPGGGRLAPPPVLPNGSPEPVRVTLPEEAPSKPLLAPEVDHHHPGDGEHEQQ